jgi:hypothetical protein
MDADLTQESRKILFQDLSSNRDAGPIFFGCCYHVMLTITPIVRGGDLIFIVYMNGRAFTTTINPTDVGLTASDLV